jgi:NAD(P)-dependent dehydrogenase (short-subunit alcohol dehydrogenase family)
VRLDGKVALITGGGAGIGRACVELFVREGARVVIAERDRASGEAACAAAGVQGGAAVFVETDVSQPASVEAAVAAAVAHFGGLDILYNNVGGSTPRDGSVVDTPFEEFQAKMNVDVFGAWLGCRYAVPELTKRGGGSIINASSMCGLIGTTGHDAYTAAKGAVTALTRSMAVGLAPHGIRVNAVAPGATLTERVAPRFSETGDAMSETRRKIAERHLLGLLEPIDVAYAVLYLASDESRRTTGHTLVVDSGMTVC